MVIDKTKRNFQTTYNFIPVNCYLEECPYETTNVCTCVWLLRMYSQHIY